MLLGLSDIWPAVAIAFFGGITCWILQQIKMERESQIVQMLVTIALLVNIARYAIQLYENIRTFARY